MRTNYFSENLETFRRKITNSFNEIGKEHKGKKFDFEDDNFNLSMESGSEQLLYISFDDDGTCHIIAGDDEKDYDFWDFLTDDLVWMHDMLLERINDNG